MITTISLLLCVSAGHADEGHDANGDASNNGATVFAVVGETVIPVEEFEANFHAGVRQRFYHGQVPAPEIAAFRREVAAAMIDRLLLLQEAERLDIQPDLAWVDAEIRQMADRLAASDSPAHAREAAQAQLLGDSVILQLRQRIEDVPAPGPGAALAYYRANPDKFTTPERLRISMILLKVEPWAGGALWEAAHEEAQRILAALRAGESFAELARLHSADGSAGDGGDLGHVHTGMLAREAQEVLDGMTEGELSEPVQLLQGFALFRLDERLAPVLNDFEKVEERVYELLHRDLREQAWKGALDRLHDETAITINTALVGGEG